MKKLNLQKIGKALTKKRSLGFKKPQPKAPTSMVKPKAVKSSMGSARKQNAARARFENLGKSSSKMSSSLRSQKSVKPAASVTKLRKSNALSRSSAPFPRMQKQRRMRRR